MRCNIQWHHCFSVEIIYVMSHQWHWHYVMPMTWSIAPLQSWDQNNWNGVQHVFLVIWCLWHWCQQQVTQSSMDPLLFVRWWQPTPDVICSGHVMSSALPPCDADCVINGTSISARSRQLKKRFDGTMSIMWCHWFQQEHNIIFMASSITPLHSQGQDDQNNVQNKTSGHVTQLVPVQVPHDTVGTNTGPLYHY